jgi:catalase
MIMTPEQAEATVQPFDVTKAGRTRLFGLNIGRVGTQQNPTTTFEVEQAVFSPAIFVPGIAASPEQSSRAPLRIQCCPPLQARRQLQ